MKRKIKVMGLIWSMGDGGAERVALNCLEMFQNDEDIDFTLFVYCKPDDSFCNQVIRNQGYAVIYLNHPQSRIRVPYVKRFFNHRIAVKTWSKAVQTFEPDIIHGHIAELLVETLDAMVNNKTPVCFTTVHSNPNRDSGYALRFIRRAFMKENVIPVCLSREQAEMAQKRYGFKRCEIINNGIKFGEIRKRIIHKSEARRRLNIPSDRYVIVGVGRLHPIKNFPLLIDAFAAVLRSRPESLLVIAGSGGKMRSLKAKTRRLGIEAKVLFLGNQRDIMPVYCAADVLGMTSKSEASPLTLLEAQCCGVRCVISSGVPAENIISNRVSQMKENATPQQWAANLLDVGYIGKSVCGEKDYELRTTFNKLKEMYLTYWRMYLNG